MALWLMRDSDTVSALPYMDAVVREGLRLLPPAPSTVREASEDSVVPLGTPIKGRDGKMMESIRINKGTTIFVRESSGAEQRCIQTAVPWEYLSFLTTP
jgi:hypothetical protein